MRCRKYPTFPPRLTTKGLISCSRSANGSTANLDECMRLLFIGDVVGRAGRIVVSQELPKLRTAFDLDCVIVNGENAAGGFGITEAIFADFLAAGADCVTLGNHSFDQREALNFIAHQPLLIRPLNYPAGTPGRGANLIETKKGARVLVINAMGRLFMDAMDDP